MLCPRAKRATRYNPYFGCRNGSMRVGSIYPRFKQLGIELGSVISAVSHLLVALLIATTTRLLPVSTSHLALIGNDPMVVAFYRYLYQGLKEYFRSLSDVCDLRWFNFKVKVTKKDQYSYVRTSYLTTGITGIYEDHFIPVGIGQGFWGVVICLG